MHINHPSKPSGNSEFLAKQIIIIISNRDCVINRKEFLKTKVSLYSDTDDTENDMKGLS